MILAIWISVGVTVVLVATFGIVLYDDWLWRRHIEQMAEAHRARTDDAKPWGEVVELHPEAKTFHSRRSS
jgi:hypothetical protein